MDLGISLEVEDRTIPRIVLAVNSIAIPGDVVMVAAALG